MNAYLKVFATRRKSGDLLTEWGNFRKRLGEWGFYKPLAGVNNMMSGVCHPYFRFEGVINSEAPKAVWKEAGDAANPLPEPLRKRKLSTSTDHTKPSKKCKASGGVSSSAQMYSVSRRCKKPKAADFEKENHQAHLSNPARRKRAPKKAKVLLPPPSVPFATPLSENAMESEETLKGGGSNTDGWEHDLFEAHISELRDEEDHDELYADDDSYLYLKPCVQVVDSPVHISAEALAEPLTMYLCDNTMYLCDIFAHDYELPDGSYIHDNDFEGMVQWGKSLIRDDVRNCALAPSQWRNVDLENTSQELVAHTPPPPLPSDSDEKEVSLTHAPLDASFDFHCQAGCDNVLLAEYACNAGFDSHTVDFTRLYGGYEFASSCRCECDL